MKSLFQLQKLLKISILPLILSDTGQMKIKLDVSEQQTEREKECIIQKTLKKYLALNNLTMSKEKLFVMREFHLHIKNMISNVKFNYLVKSFQKQKLSKISVQALIMKEKVSKPFYTKFTKEKSKKLWLPTGTDCVDSDLNCLNGFSNNIIQNSWFSTQLSLAPNHQMNLLKTYSQSLTTSLLKTMDSDRANIKGKETKKTSISQMKIAPKKTKLKVNSSIQYKVYPRGETKKTLTNWFGASRWIYNKALDYINSKDYLPKLDELRLNIVNDVNYKSDNKWMLDIRYDIRDEAVRDLLMNIEKNLNNGGRFNMRFKRRHDEQSISILKKHWDKRRGSYYNVYKDIGCKRYNIEYTSRLKRTKLGEYYLCIPRNVNVSENQTDKSRILSIDPGVRTFLTCFDPQGRVLEFGKGDICRLRRLLGNVDKLRSKITKAKSKKKIRLKKSMYRLNKKLKNLVEDIHKRVSKWMCENYDCILIPKMNSATFKNINRRVRRRMSVWRHCSFIKRLEEKTKLIRGCRIEVIDESYTSKTCTSCGYIKSNLHGEKVFSCDKCKLIIDRDINGSRNILLKYITNKRVQ